MCLLVCLCLLKWVVCWSAQYVHVIHIIYGDVIDLSIERTKKNNPSSCWVFFPPLSLSLCHLWSSYFSYCERTELLQSVWNSKLEAFKIYAIATKTSQKQNEINGESRNSHRDTETNPEIESKTSKESCTSFLHTDYKIRFLRAKDPDKFTHSHTHTRTSSTKSSVLYANDNVRFNVSTIPIWSMCLLYFCCCLFCFVLLLLLLLSCNF